jgi:hypothetical protein
LRPTRCGIFTLREIAIARRAKNFPRVMTSGNFSVSVSHRFHDSKLCDGGLPAMRAIFFRAK